MTEPASITTSEGARPAPILPAGKDHPEDLGDVRAVLRASLIEAAGRELLALEDAFGRGPTADEWRNLADAYTALGGDLELAPTVSAQELAAAEDRAARFADKTAEAIERRDELVRAVTRVFAEAGRLDGGYFEGEALAPFRAALRELFDVADANAGTGRAAA